MRPSANSRTPSVFRKTGLLVLLSGVALLFLTHSAQAQDATGGVNPLGLSMSREHPPSFEPGQTLEVVVVVQAAGSGQLLAMGLRETIPSGWSMESVGGLSGAPPDIAPGPGTQGRLEFAWVTPPDRFPYSFSYTLLPPEDAGGAQYIHGALEYRLMGGANYAPPVVTELRGPAPKPPQITLSGGNPMRIEEGQPWVEPGYTALDGANNDVSAKVRVTGTVDTATPGTYTVTYAADSVDGNQTMTVTRTVIVTPKKTVSPSTGTSIAPPGGATGSNRPQSNAIASTAGTEKPAETAVSAANTAKTPFDRPDMPDLSGHRPDLTPSAPGKAGKPMTPPGATANAAESSVGSTTSGVDTLSSAPDPAMPVTSPADKTTPESGGNAPATGTERHDPAKSAAPSAKGLLLAAGLVAALVVLGFLGWRLAYSRPVRRAAPKK